MTKKFPALTVLISLGSVIWPQGGHTATWNVVSEQSRIDFLAVGRPSLLKIRGVGKGLSGKVERKSQTIEGTLELDLHHLESGIEKRDVHMKERYLEVAKFPKTLLKISPCSDKVGDQQEFSGELTLHGVTRPIQGTTTISAPEGSSQKAQADFKIKLTDFGIEIPKFAGISVADEVEIHTEIQVQEAK